MENTKLAFFDFDGTLSVDSPNPYETLLKNSGFFQRLARKRANRKGKNADLRIGTVKNKSKVYKPGDVKALKKSGIANRLYTFAKDLYCKTFLHKIFSAKLVLSVFAKIFKISGIKESDLFHIADKTKLLDNLTEGLKYLKSQGYKVYIISGGLEPVVKRALGEENLKYIDGLCVAKVEYNKNGVINKIVSKNYDNEGKAKFILEKMNENGVDASQTVFVGNDSNDVYVGGLAKCNTICVNGEDGATKAGKSAWSAVIDDTHNFKDVVGKICKLICDKTLQNNEQCGNSAQQM